jgi:hypothetical protein
MYLTNYDCIPLWAWGIHSEELRNVESLERTELRHWEEGDLLTDIDFTMEDF